jgi:hypothetical protein
MAGEQIAGMPLQPALVIFAKEDQYMLKRSVSLFLIALVVAISMSVAPSLAQAPTGAGSLTVPVTGTAQGAGRVTGTFKIERFVDNGGSIGAFGTLVLSTPKGTTVTQAVMPVTVAHRSATAGVGGAGAAVAQVVCSVLDLTLGPLDLNLLGLEIHLDTVHLTIGANPASGLLGDLLSGLLCGGLDLGGVLGVLQTAIDFLNSILDALGGLA